MTPQGKTVFDYAASNSPETAVAIPPLLNKEGNEGRFLNSNSPLPDPLLIKERVKAETEIPAENLPASAVSSEVVSDKFNFPYIPAIALVFIGASAGAVYFIRQKKVVSVNSSQGDDFKILDE